MASYGLRITGDFKTDGLIEIKYKLKELISNNKYKFNLQNFRE